MEGTQTVSEQEQSEQQQKVEQERSKLVTYTVKLSNGAKFTRLNPVSLRPDNSHLYRKFGYFETGTEEFHPPRSRKVEVECHLLIMSKAL